MCESYETCKPVFLMWGFLFCRFNNLQMGCKYRTGADSSKLTFLSSHVPTIKIFRDDPKTQIMHKENYKSLASQLSVQVAREAPVPQSAILCCRSTRNDFGNVNTGVVTHMRVVAASCNAEAQTSRALHMIQVTLRTPPA